MGRGARRSYSPGGRSPALQGVSVLGPQEAPRAGGFCAGLSAAPGQAKGPIVPPAAGPFAVTWQELVVSLEAAVLLMPLHLLIVHAFRLAQPPPPPADPPLSQPVATVPSKQSPTITHIQQVRTQERPEQEGPFLGAERPASGSRPPPSCVCPVGEGCQAPGLPRS